MRELPLLCINDVPRTFLPARYFLPASVNLARVKVRKISSKKERLTKLVVFPEPVADGGGVVCLSYINIR